jgi:hypothetical protein
MQVETLTLGITENAEAMINAGTAYRDGGIVREIGSGRIVSFLHDADNTARGLLEASVVPLAVLGISMLAINRRFEKIEAELQDIKNMLKELILEVQLINSKLDIQMFCKLKGAMYACHLDIKCGQLHRLSEYRHVFIETHEQFYTLSRWVITNDDLLSRHEPELKQYIRAMLLAGIAARDVSFQMDDDSGAIDVTKTISFHSQEIADVLEKCLKKTKNLFWRTEAHINLALEARESTARIRSHEQELHMLHRNEIIRNLPRQLET